MFASWPIVMCGGMASGVWMVVHWSRMQPTMQRTFAPDWLPGAMAEDLEDRDLQTCHRYWQSVVTAVQCSAVQYIGGMVPGRDAGTNGGPARPNAIWPSASV